MAIESGFKLGFEAPIQVIYNYNAGIFPTSIDYALISQIVEGQTKWNEIYVLSNQSAVQILKESYSISN